MINNTIRRLFIVNGGCIALIRLASFMRFEIAVRNAIYLGVTFVWAAILGTALVLVAVAFQRRLITMTNM